MENTFRAKLISGLEKCFLDEKIEDKFALDHDTMLKNERYTFQVAYTEDAPAWARSISYVKIESPIADYVHVSCVEPIPVRFPVYKDQPAEAYDNYLRTTPGLYPDLLRPYEEHGFLNYLSKELNSIWVEIDPKGNVPAGTYPVTVVFTAPDGVERTRLTFSIEILNASLPEQKTLVTEWFHTDCLSVYYHAPVFTEEYWRIVDNFMANASKNGINLILTPTFTPPLDTEIGGERPTVQLVDVTVKDGKYSFEFSKLGRWVALANKNGIENFEIAHFFTQWGATSAPKVMATVYNADGTSEYKRIFGWDTPATGEAYSTFLRQFVTELLAYMKALGKDHNCYFHISDEPNDKQLESYLAAKEIIKDLLKDYTIMDALSHYEFYESGALETPIPSNNSIEPFIANNVPNLWTYYCCGQFKDVSNRFFAMPSDRNRVIGIQFYKYNIVGFLQWGYNFYFNCHSIYPIDPYQISDGDYFTPAGDCYSVYPAANGTAYDSLRICTFFDALQDQRAMQLAESLCGREAVMNAIEGDLPEDQKITFARYPHGIAFIHETRAKINALIASKI
ncbi:MAG: DUF4091 domain-containing protein [Clostridia bacterium]|nr:DUF4091 domain-containing protein [Clostridia bacterium]